MENSRDGRIITTNYDGNKDREIFPTTEPKPVFNLIFMKQACKQVGKSLLFFEFDTLGNEITRITPNQEILKGAFEVSPEETDYSSNGIIDNAFEIALLNSPARMAVACSSTKVIVQVERIQDSKTVFLNSFPR